MDDRGKLSKGGSRILRHRPKAHEEGAIAHADMELIEAHLERTVGPIERVFHEIVSDLVHIDVYWVPASDERRFHTLVTGGMSARPMTVPDADVNPWGELAVLLPPGWRMDEAAGSDERWYWPIRWLKRLARLPHEYDTWLGWGHTIPNGDPPEPFAPGTSLSGFILMPSTSLPDEAQHIDRPEGGAIDVYTIWPLHAAEMDLKLAEGAQALAEALDEAGVGDVIDAARPSVVSSPPPRLKPRRRR